jgi:hypothetical protein
MLKIIKLVGAYGTGYVLGWLGLFLILAMVGA